jgi:hypothetical protein
MKMNKTIGLILLLVGAFAAGLLLGRTTAPHPSGLPPLPITSAPFVSSASPSSLPSLLEGVPDVRQSTGYTCGAAALQAVLAYWGTQEREDRLAARLRSTP